MAEIAAQVEKIANIQRELNKMGEKLVVDGVYGPKTKSAIMRQFAPAMRRAIVVAEGNKRNYGVLSEKTKTPSEAYRIMSNSVENTVDRFMAGKPNLNQKTYSSNDRFVDYMQRTWAPIGAKNDPKNLNKNWAPNVRKSLLKQLGPENYEKLRRMRLAQVPQPATVA